MFLVDVEGHRDRVAVVDGATGESWTYAQLAARVEAAAEAFDAPDKALVFVFASNEVGFLVAYLAASEREHAVCLLDATLDPARRDSLVALYRPTFVVDCAAPGAGAAYRPAGDGWRPIDSSEAAVSIFRSPGGSDDPPLDRDLGLLLSTSGTLGSPKLVRLRRASVVANARSIAESLGIEPDTRAPTSLPPSYSYGLSVINSHLYAGASLVFTRHGIVSREFWTEFRTHGCSSFAGVPFAYQALERLRIDRSPPPGLKVMTQAGGRLAVPTAERFHAAMAARGGSFFVMYGQTEATARMSCLPSGRFFEKKGSVGVAIPGGRFRVEPVDGLADAGEVVYEGPNVMMGYATSRADLARGDECTGALRTGDLGRMDHEGFLTLTGRVKRIAKVFGTRFNLDEVEALATSDGPAAAVAGEDRIVLFAELAPGAEEALRRRIADALRVHRDGVDVRRTERLPRNANGKIDYAELQLWSQS